MRNASRRWGWVNYIATHSHSLTIKPPQPVRRSSSLCLRCAAIRQWPNLFIVLMAQPYTIILKATPFMERWVSAKHSVLRAEQPNRRHIRDTGHRNARPFEATHAINKSYNHKTQSNFVRSFTFRDSPSLTSFCSSSSSYTCTIDTLGNLIPIPYTECQIFELFYWCFNSRNRLNLPTHYSNFGCFMWPIGLHKVAHSNRVKISIRCLQCHFRFISLVTSTRHLHSHAKFCSRCHSTVLRTE